MTELDRQHRQLQFHGDSIVFLSARSAPRQRKKMFAVMVLVHFYSKSLGARLPVCPVNKNKVLMLIKV